VCLVPPTVIDGTELGQKVLSTVVRTGERFGAGHIVDSLTGKATDKIVASGARPAVDLRHRRRPQGGRVARGDPPAGRVGVPRHRFRRLRRACR
jgi:superfamily II DNA helicase RecQ